MKPQAYYAVLVAALVSVGCFYASIIIGALGLFMGLATPLAPAWIQFREGTWAGIAGTGLAAIGVGLILGWPWPVIYLGVHGAAALVLPWLLRQQRSWDQAIVGALMVAVLIGGAIYVAHFASSGQSVPQVIETHIRTELDVVLNAESSQFTAEQKKEIEQIGEQMVEYARIAWPGFSIFMSALLIALTFFGLSCLAKGKRLWRGVPFAQWKSPEWLVWVAIGSGFALLLPNETASVVGANLLIVLLPVYFLQGLAIVTWWLQRKPVSPFFRGMTYFMVIAVNPMPLILTGVGLFDLWVDFRKPRLKTN